MANFLIYGFHILFCNLPFINDELYLLKCYFFSFLKCLFMYWLFLYWVGYVYHGDLKEVCFSYVLQILFLLCRLTFIISGQMEVLLHFLSCIYLIHIYLLKFMSCLEMLSPNQGYKNICLCFLPVLSQFLLGLFFSWLTFNLFFFLEVCFFLGEEDWHWTYTCCQSSAFFFLSLNPQYIFVYHNCRAF